MATLASKRHCGHLIYAKTDGFILISLPDGGEVSLQQFAVHRGRVEQILHRVLQTPRRQRSLAGGGLEAVQDRQGESDQNDV